MTVDPLLLEAPCIAADWPFSLLGGKWRIQCGGHCAIHGEVIAIHSVEHSTKKKSTMNLIFVKTENGKLGIVPEPMVCSYWRDEEGGAPAGSASTPEMEWINLWERVNRWCAAATGGDAE